MKNLTKITAFAVAALLVLTASPAMAVSTSTTPTQITATVDQVLALDVKIFERQGSSNVGPVTAMNHGTLVRSTNATTGAANALRGKEFRIFAGMNTSGRQYQLTQTHAGLSSGTNTLPNAMVVAGAVASSDGSGTDNITGDILTTARSARGTDVVIYTSNSQGQAATAEIVYGLSGGNADGSAPFAGWQPIPPDQASGTYSGTVTFTLTTL